MKTTLTVLLVTSLTLAGCGGWRNSGLNPGNWFGNSRSVPVEESATAAAEPVNPLLPPERAGVFKRPDAVDISVPIATVSNLRIEPTPSGAIIYAEGIATRQGAYGAQLRPVTTAEEAESGVLSLSFRVAYPEDPTVVGTEFSRTVHVAYKLDRQELASIRTVRVVGRENVRESRRR